MAKTTKGLVWFHKSECERGLATWEQLSTSPYQNQKQGAQLCTYYVKVNGEHRKVEIRKHIAELVDRNCFIIKRKVQFWPFLKPEDQAPDDVLNLFTGYVFPYKKTPEPIQSTEQFWQDKVDNSVYSCIFNKK